MKFVLLSDVVGSRHIGNRKKFEKSLTAAVNRVNTEQRSIFELEVRIWKGLDELAAIVANPAGLYAVMDTISAEIAPQQMRFVVVKGAVDTASAEGDVSKADGDAFPKAAALMIELKKEGLPFACDTGNEQTNRLWKTQVNLLMLLKKGWTAQQYQVYRLYSTSGSQEAVAKQLKISQQAVSKTLKSIEAAQVRLLEKEVESWMQSELGKK